MICLLFLLWWSLAIRSAYKAQCLGGKNGRAPSFMDDIHTLFDSKANILLLALPVAGILIFTVLPLIFMISMAFTSYDHNHLVLFDWVGLQNFKAVFSNSGSIVSGRLFLSVLTWTLVWAFFATFLNFFFGLFLAMIIQRNTTRGKGFWRAVFSMSIAVPQFVSLLVMHQMLQPQGAVNRILEQWGWINGPMPFFTDATWARVTVIVINLWVGIPYTIMQVTGILQNIPAELYEAAKIDGASYLYIFRRIAVPMGVPIFVTVGLFSGLGYWNDWTNGLYYINDAKLYSIQTLLNKMIQDIQALQANATAVSSGAAMQIPTVSVRMAIAFVALAPILAIYPFLQKYFAEGIAMGAVKG